MSGMRPYHTDRHHSVAASRFARRRSYSGCRSMFFRTLFLTICWAGLSITITSPHVAQALPDGFIAEVVSTAKGITGRFAPNPRNNGQPMLLVVSKEGEVSVLENPDSGDDTDFSKILDLSGSMCTNGERGLQSIEIHPQFSNNRWVYLYYNKLKDGCLEDANDGPSNVLARYTMNAETLELEDEEILLTGMALEKSMHNGGAMLFGTDGRLYLTTGDGGVRANAQNKANLHGSLLRLNDDGSVPDDNPFAGNGQGVPCGQSNGKLPGDASDSAVCSEIFAYGFRNPFRMAADHRGGSDSQTKFTISDVGAQNWEEISWGGSDYGGANYGWPDREGPCEASSIDQCSPLSDSNIVEPFHYYQHKSKDEGGCVAGAAVVPESLWPTKYKYLFIDFIFLKIFNLIEDSDSECRDCSPPVSGYRNETFYESIHEDGQNVNEARMTDMFFGPYEDTQALYVIKFGNQDSIIRIRYNGKLNKPPIPQFEIKKDDEQVQQLLVGEVVTLDGSLSTDPEGDALTFAWDFGDGSTSTSVSPTHEFGTPGEYRVKLVVTDAEDQAQQISMTVVVGQPPNATILSPAFGDEFFVGEVLSLLGEAFDFQGNPIADDQLRWVVERHHAEHFHPFMDETSGNNFDLFPAPEPEDFYAATNSFLRVIMYATDNNGLTTEVSRDVQPRLVMVDVVSEPQGLEVIVEDNAVATPNRITSWVSCNLPLRVEDQPPYIFQSWSDGNTNRTSSLQLLSELTDPMVKAIFCLEDDANCTEADNCCTGYCSLEGSCVETPETSTPTVVKPDGNTTDVGNESDPPVFADETTEDEGGTSTAVGDESINQGGNGFDFPVDVPPEDNVGNKDPSSLPWDWGNSINYTSNTMHSDESTDTNDGSEISNAGKWLLSLSVLLVWMCVIMWYFSLGYRKNRREKATIATRSCSDGQSLPSFVATPRKGSKKSTTTPETDMSDSMAELSTFTGSIWAKLAEENDRRAKLRARWSHSNDSSTADTSSPGVVATPETVALSPPGSDSSPGLQGTIDDAFVRLDDLLARAFAPRQRRKADQDPTDAAENPHESSPMYDVELNTSRNLIDVSMYDIFVSRLHRSKTVRQSGHIEQGESIEMGDGGSVDASMISSQVPLPPLDVTIGSLPPPPPPPPHNDLATFHDGDTALLQSMDFGATSRVESDDCQVSFDTPSLDDGLIRQLPSPGLVPREEDRVGTSGLVDTSDYLSMEFGTMTSMMNADTSSVHSSEFSS